MVGLDLGGDVTTLDEGRAEEDERVGRTGYVVLCLLLPVTRLFRTRAFEIRGEERRCGLCILDRWFICESARCDGRGEGDLLRSSYGLHGIGPCETDS